ncbi:DUF1659 domain-containing protein [Isachenkonia alkalipeptolytica]|uniref:DUF1659 domain-containing protein n=1 Tax=Isachenkonia alkalipeptolytica TaxID=2565777 RepID=A0AA43XLX2_9CLOT|nr:DUF1659 domain-containing protein [Isachenkonia alkalipeptolytica]NBG88644.1 DUF1659 domain-containing protein [Isachenkonia alkalipeptolytica]
MDRKRMRLQVVAGMDPDGNEILRSRTISNLKFEAQDENINIVAGALGSLIATPLKQVTRIEEVVL